MEEPVLLKKSAHSPTAVLAGPVVLDHKAPAPTAVLPSPPLFWNRAWEAAMRRRSRGS